MADRLSPARRAQVDALKLLAVFVQHMDSKPEQQALVCADGKTAKDRSGNATCREPLLVVKDLGSTFGAGSKFSFEKMKLASWRSVPIWKDAPGCQGHLTRSLIGTLEHPVISEAGRRFLADRLSLLNDRQLRDLFTAARVERRQDKVDGRQATVDDWVRVFKAKRDEIRNRRCDGVAYTFGSMTSGPSTVKKGLAARRRFGAIAVVCAALATLAPPVAAQIDAGLLAKARDRELVVNYDPSANRSEVRLTLAPSGTGGDAPAVILDFLGQFAGREPAPGTDHADGANALHAARRSAGARPSNRR